MTQHAVTCRAYGNYQPPYQECTCGADECLDAKDGKHRWVDSSRFPGAQTCIECGSRGAKAIAVPPTETLERLANDNAALRRQIDACYDALPTHCGDLIVGIRALVEENKRLQKVASPEPLLSEAVEWIERLALSGANHGQNESEGRCERCRHLWSQHAVDCEVPAVLARLRAGRSVDFLESVNAALSSAGATHRIERNDSTGQAKAYRVAEAAPPTWQDIRALIAEWRSSANFIADVLVPTPEGAQDEFRLRNCADALEKLLPAPPQDERTKP